MTAPKRNGPPPASLETLALAQTRCFKAAPACAESEPPLEAVNGTRHAAACFYAEPIEP